MPRSLVHLIVLLTAPILLSAVSTAQAGEARQEGLHITHPFAIPTPPGAPNGAAYLDITVDGNIAARLKGASSPIAGKVELHDMRMQDGMMRMRRVEGIEIAPGETLKMHPGGGYHLMLRELDHALQPGERFPLTLEFERRGSVKVEVQVQKAQAGTTPADSHPH
ncbi:copper chaperone PCu(A)C [Halomonas shantousis]